MVFLFYPSHVLNSHEFEGGNIVVQISGSQLSRIHYDQPNNKTIKYIKGPIDFVICASYELQSRCQTLNCRIFKASREKILKGTKQNDTHNHEHNPTHNAIFREAYATVVGRLLRINPFLNDSCVKVGPDIAFSEKLRVLSLIVYRKYVYNSTKNLFNTRLFRCNKIVSDAITRNNFVTPVT